MKKTAIAALISLTLAFAWAGCGELEEAVLVGGAEPPYHKMGVNVFPRNRSATDLLSQMYDIKSLGMNSIRVTFWFDSQYMSSSRSKRDFSQFDEVVNAAEAAGLEIVAILAYVPDWLRGNSGWKTTFINQYAYPVVSRYKNRIDYWEVWNEPDEMTYDVLNGSADDYFDLLKQVSQVIRATDPSAKILTAATANIVADGLSKFEWTKRLLDLGAAQYADILNVHYYSELDIELSAVAGPLVAQAGMTVWVTETGKTGHNNMESYFNTVMPYIDKSINPERIYWYCYVEGEGVNERISPDSTYGLVTMWNGTRHESSLYSALKYR